MPFVLCQSAGVPLLQAFTLFCLLLVGHALCDFPLQGDFLARAKNHRQPVANVPWQFALTAHAVIQGGMVGFITGSVAFGCVEFLAHWLIDWAKCDEQISFSSDQYLHVACKLAWVAGPWIAAVLG